MSKTRYKFENNKKKNTKKNTKKIIGSGRKSFRISSNIDKLNNIVDDVFNICYLG